MPLLPQRFNSGVQVHLLHDGDSDWFLQNIQNECTITKAFLKDVHIVNLRELQGKDPREAAFARIYFSRHCSCNRFQYEQLCFQRFFWLNAWMIRERIDRVLFLDSDMLITGDMFRQYPMDGPFWSLMAMSTWCLMFTQPVLDDWLGFLNQLYNGPLENFLVTVNEYGGNENVSNPPANWPRGISWQQFSDMYAFRAFLKSRPDLYRLAKIDAGYDDRPTKMEVVDAALHNLGAELGCERFDGWVNASAGFGSEDTPDERRRTSGSSLLSLALQEIYGGDVRTAWDLLDLFENAACRISSACEHS